MRYIEPHIHGELVEPIYGFRGMATAGVEAVINLSTYTISPNTTHKELENYHEHMYTYWYNQYEMNGMQPFFGFGAPVVGMDKEEAEKSIPKIREYLEKPEAVCVGEVGIDFTTENEVEIYEKMIELAEEFDMPLNTHTPVPQAEERTYLNKGEVIDKVLEIVDEKGFDPSNLVICHISHNTIDKVLEAGAWADISCCADKLNAREAAKLAQKHKDDRILVTSETGWGVEGQYSVPQVAYEMKLLGMSREDIEKIAFENPVELFDLDLKF